MRRDEISLIEVWAIARDIAVAHGIPMLVAVRDVLAAREALSLGVDTQAKHAATCAGTGDPATCGCQGRASVFDEIERVQQNVLHLTEMVHEAAGQILNAVRASGAGE